jgi:hypothetical protein
VPPLRIMRGRDHERIQREKRDRSENSPSVETVEAHHAAALSEINRPQPSRSWSAAVVRRARGAITPWRPLLLSAHTSALMVGGRCSLSSKGAVTDRCFRREAALSTSRTGPWSRCRSSIIAPVDKPRSSGRGPRQGLSRLLTAIGFTR